MSRKRFDFKRLVFKIPERGPIADANPKFHQYDVLVKDLPVLYEKDPKTVALEIERETALKFIILAYDRGSPFIQFETPDRKEHAAIEAGISERNKIFEPLVRGEIPEVNEMINAFFLVMNDRDYERYISGCEAVSQIFSKLREPIAADADVKFYAMKKTNFENSGYINEELEKLEKKLFLNNDPSLNADTVSRFTKGRAERYAENLKLKNGNNITT